VGIWVQGCSIGCSGCLSTDTWPAPSETQWVTVQALVRRIIDLVQETAADGLTVSGGEPFDQPAALLELILGVRSSPELEDLDVLIYSGYTFRALRRRYASILGRIDALISGPFVEGEPTTLPWRGSGNQRLHLLTARARDRFGRVSAHHLQVSADGGQVWITGIPQRGDLDQFLEQLKARGVEVRDVSWRP
jgi:anaerobic ribonucleoside-triphosphate reductase activating protein